MKNEIKISSFNIRIHTELDGINAFLNRFSNVECKNSYKINDKGMYLSDHDAVVSTIIL